MANEMLNLTLLADLRRLDETINRNEDTSIRARSEYGHKIRVVYELRPFGERKQLPAGVLDALAKELGVCRAEVGARMRFAAMYDTEEKLSTVIESVKSWSAIRQRALTDTARAATQTKTPLRRAFDLLDSIDPDTLNPEDARLIDTAIATLRRLRGNVAEEQRAA